MAKRLTSELVATVNRVLADSGPRPGSAYLDEADYQQIAGQLLASHPQAGDPWVFAYGSLIWKTAFPTSAARRATVSGWHRSFALRLTRWRGTPECPGLMLTLDRGGSCRGMLYRMQDGNVQRDLLELLKREMTVKPSSVSPRWVWTRTEDGPLRALAFTVNRKGPAYVGRLPDEEVADTLSKAAGHWGSCAEYLLQTVDNLERHGIRDHMLWKMQARVAERIAARAPVLHAAHPAREARS